MHLFFPTCIVSKCNRGPWPATEQAAQFSYEQCRCQLSLPKLTPCLLPYSADQRKGYCFRHLVGGRCSSQGADQLMAVTKADCCCTMGTAWGPECEHCPSRYSREYEELCLEAGYSIDGSGQFCGERAGGIGGGCSTERKYYFS